MKEVEAYKLFAHSPHVIHSVDYAIASERNDPSSKTVYVLLPYYQRGNLQDMINANLVNHTRFPERRLMELFLGVCRGLRDMHVYAGGGGPGGERMAMLRTDGVDENVQVVKGRKRGAAGADDEDESEQQRPLMTGEEDTSTVTGGKERSYAHRDIKPGLSSIHPPFVKIEWKKGIEKGFADGVGENREYNDRRRRLVPHPHGPGQHSRVAATDHVPVAGDRHPGHGGRAQHDAVPRPRAV